MGRQAIRRFVHVGFGIALLFAAAGIFESLSTETFRGAFPLLGSTGARGGLVSITSFLRDEGEAGWFFAFAACAAYAFFMATRRRHPLFFFFLFSLMAALTLRRKPIGGILVVLLLSTILASRPSQRTRNVAVLVGTVLLLGLTVGSVLLPIMLEGYSHYINPADPYQVARNLMYITSYRLALDNFPFGVGFGLFGGFVSQMSYSPIYDEYGLSRLWGLSSHYSSFIMDAFWPHVLGETGFFGLVGFLVMLVAVWRPVLVRYRQGLDHFGRALCLLSCFAFVESFVESFAAPVFESTLPACLLFASACFARMWVVEPGQRA